MGEAVRRGVRDAGREMKAAPGATRTSSLGRVVSLFEGICYLIGMAVGFDWLMRRALGHAGPPDQIQRDGAFLLLAIVGIIAVGLGVRLVRGARRGRA